MATTYKIHPGVGIARVGSKRDPHNFANDYFIGPEIPGWSGVERVPNQPSPVYRFIESYKDRNGDIKRQGARFRVFQYEDGKAPVQVTPRMGTIRWRVRLANTKATLDIVKNTGTKDELNIVPEFPDIEGVSKGQPESKTGKFRNIPVSLGELRTDEAGHLIVLGGLGRSGSSKTGAGLSGLWNQDWYDDVSDGPVDAWVTIGGQEHPAVGAWVIVAPPDFAPRIDPLVSLYDVARDRAVWRWEQEGKLPGSRWLKKPDRASYQTDIAPLIHNAQLMKWIEGGNRSFWNAVSQVTGSFWVKGDPNLTKMSQLLEAAPGKLNSFSYTGLQKELLEMWKNGDFVDDHGVPFPSSPSDLEKATPLNLDVAALRACVGSSFSPGIEASKLMGVPEIYSEPFRLSRDTAFKNPDTDKMVARLEPGALTQYLSLPWQADFYECEEGWWPAQRPSSVRLSTSPDSHLWTRGIDTKEDLVKSFSRLGYITTQSNAVGYFEHERDPQLPPAVA
jgi:L-lysine epsilon oxidase C-terminal domain/L-Lysine epsilon oxidase N-terminal